MMTSTKNEWILFGNELKDLVKDVWGNLVLLLRTNLFYYRGQPCFTTGGNLVLRQGATLFYYRGQPCFTTGGNLVLLQGATLFFYRGQPYYKGQLFYFRRQPCFTSGGNLVLLQGANLFYCRGKTCKGVRGEGTYADLHKPFNLILLDLQLTMDIIPIKSHAS